MSEVVLGTGRTAHALVLRAVLGLLVATMLVVAWSSSRPLLGLVAGLAAAFGAVAAMRPWSIGTALAVAAAGFLVVTGSAASLPTVIVLVLLVHLALWGSALAARVSWRGRVELAVVAGGLRSLARVQVGAQVLAVVAVLLAGTAVGQADVWRALALLAAIAVTVLALPRTPSDD